MFVIAEVSCVSRLELAVSCFWANPSAAKAKHYQDLSASAARDACSRLEAWQDLHVTDHGQPSELRMELLENGLDELSSAVEALHGSPTTSRNLKRAITDLATGAELLLKERLRRHDWRQLFDDVAIANESELRRGDFISPTTPEVLRRLREAGVTIPRRHRQRLDALRARRNRIEHFALIDSEEAIRTSAAGCLSVLLDFVVDHLDLTTLSEVERKLFDEVRDALPHLTAYGDARRQDIATSLREALAGTTVVTCPSCDEDALVLDGGCACLFCRYRADAIDAADDYLGAVAVTHQA